MYSLIFYTKYDIILSVKKFQRFDIMLKKALNKKKLIKLRV